MTRRKTSQEQGKIASAEVKAKAELAAKQEIVDAKVVLQLLKSTLVELQRKHKRVLRHSIEALKDEIAFLVAESPVYRDAAAELFTSVSADALADMINRGNEALRNVGLINPAAKP